MKQPKETTEVVTLFEKLTATPPIVFPPLRTKLEVTNERGVYIIRNKAGLVVHVGRNTRAKGGIEQRLKDHLSGRSSFVREFFNGKGSKLRKNYTYQYLSICDRRKRALVEAYAVGNLCPEHLGVN